MKHTQLFLDLNRDRIKEVLLETYDICQNQLDVEFTILREDFAAKINPYLDSNRVSIPVFISLPSHKFPELVIEVNLRRKGVFARMGHRKKQAELNYYLKVL